jgi:hypothetical protein
MEADLEKLHALKNTMDGLQEEYQRTQGALDVALKTLKDEFNCDTLEEAEILSNNLQAVAEEHEKLFNTAYKTFMTEYGDKLNVERE